MQRAGARDRRHPAGGRARLIAALAALAALVAPLVASGSARGRLPDADVIASVRRAHALADRIAASSAEARDVIANVHAVADEVASLAERVERARMDSLGERRALDARLDDSRAAAGRAARRVIPDTTDLAALDEPLDVVSSAIHASDALAIQALDAQAEVARFERDVAALGVLVRQTRFHVATTSREIAAAIDQMTGDLRSASQGRARSMVVDVRGAPEDAAVVVGQLQDADLELRAAEWRLSGVSSAVDDWRAGARRAVASSRRSLAELYGDMLIIQNVASSVMPAFSSVFDGVTAPPVAATGNGPLFVCPVDEPRSYSDDWGAPRYAGGFHLHQGNDVFSPKGTPIRAPFDGTAVDASNSLGGYAVSVYGTDGYAYNAHLLSFGQLGEVTAGTIIGYVGNTGDADATPPHDHFEWHPANGGPVDPYPYLNAVCERP